MAKEDVSCPACGPTIWETIFWEETKPAIQCYMCGGVLLVDELDRRKPGAAKRMFWPAQKEWWDWETKEE